MYWIFKELETITVNYESSAKIFQSLHRPCVIQNLHGLCLKCDKNWQQNFELQHISFCCLPLFIILYFIILYLIKRCSTFIKAENIFVPQKYLSNYNWTSTIFSSHSCFLTNGIKQLIEHGNGIYNNII